MPDELLIGIGGLVVAGLAYFAGVRRGTNLLSVQLAHAKELQDSDHALQRDLAHQQLRAAAIDRVVATYSRTVRNRLSSGIYAVADSGIATLESHEDATEALRRMQLEEGHDPIKGQRAALEGVNLVAFFRYVRENGINFSQTTVGTVLQRMRAEGADPSLRSG